MVGFIAPILHQWLSRNPTALLLEKEPANLQAQSLSQLIDKAVTKGTLAHCFSCSSPLVDTPGQRATSAWRSPVVRRRWVVSSWQVLYGEQLENNFVFL